MNTSASRPSLCIGILTLNEEKRIVQCIRSAHFADQILVIDSGSQDQTQALAREAGAEVHDYPDWQGFAEQRNRMLRHCRCDFIFSWMPTKKSRQHSKKKSCRPCRSLSM